MKTKSSSSFERDYRSNITKAYWFKFFRNFHLFSAVLVPFFIDWGHISFTQIMILQAIFTFSIFLLEVPTGVIADKLGRKTSLIIAAITGVIAPLIYSSYASFWVFAFAEFLWAVGAAFTSGADSALIYDSLKATKKQKESKKVFSNYGSYGLAALFVAAPLGSLVAQTLGARMTMFFTSVPMLIAVFIAFSFKEPKEQKKKDKKGYFETFLSGFKYIRSHKVLPILVFDYVIIGSLAFFIIWVYQVVLQANNLSIGLFGFVHAGLVLGQVIVLTYISRIEKIFGGKKNYLVYSALIVGASFLVLAFSKNIIVIIGSIILIASFGLTRKNLFASYFNKFIESHNRATVLSTVSMGYSFSLAILDIVLGVVVDWNLKVGLIIVGAAIIGFTLLSRLEEDHLID